MGQRDLIKIHTEEKEIKKTVEGKEVTGTFTTALPSWNLTMHTP